ncbi:protein SAMBA-like [Durio zibethinus]|uniref:Protein SAMBA-like n=1 Tax=Durio zibethinus TaxID=66656 RepID=A0A6P5Y7Z6_DURZI|nr:protein SAMBA-like [Durio zibethinus]
MNSSSPASSSLSTTAIVGGAASATNAALEDFHFPSDRIPIQDPKDEAMLVLKSDLMAALNEKVKSLDEDNWKFEGPRSRIHLISRPGGFLQKQMEFTKNRCMSPQK